MVELFIEPFKEDFPDTYRILVSDRNNAWTRKLEELLQTEEVEFVLVGAIHLPGEDGILSQLENRGCVIGKP